MSRCICHPGPYHKPECPCQAAFTRMRAAELEADPTTPEEAERQARDLIDAGYVQVSRKYRLVAKLRGNATGPHRELSVKVFDAFRFIEQGRFLARVANMLPPRYLGTKHGERFLESLPTGTVVEVRTVEPRDRRTPGTACYVAFEVKRPCAASPKP